MFKIWKHLHFNVYCHISSHEVKINARFLTLGNVLYKLPENGFLFKYSDVRKCNEIIINSWYIYSHWKLGYPGYILKLGYLHNLSFVV